MAKTQNTESQGASREAEPGLPGGAAATRESGPNNSSEQSRSKAEAARASKKKSRKAERDEALNFIRAVRPRSVEAKEGSPKDATEKNRDIGAGREQNTIERPRDTRSMPDHISDRYVQDGRDWYLTNGDPGFSDYGDRATTRSENIQIIRDLIDIFKHRDNQVIEVGGTKEFRRLAWQEAKLQGLEVQGYKPSRVEQALLIRALASAGTPTGQRTPQAEGPLRPGRAEAFDYGSDTEPRQAADRTERKPDESQPSLITGRLVRHDRGVYPNDPDKAMSYYVVIKPERGKEFTIWGVDLERAIKQSLTHVQNGDQIGLRSVTRSDFKRKVNRPNEEGRLVEQEVDAHRNGWIVEQKRFFDDRAALAKIFRDESIKPAEATRRHPELRGTYLDFQARKLRAEEASVHPEDRAEMIRALRQRIADTIERGEPLKPMQMVQNPPQRETELTNGEKMPDPQTLTR